MLPLLDLLLFCSDFDRKFFCLGYITETIRFKKLIIGRDIGWGVLVCSVMQWYGVTLI